MRYIMVLGLLGACANINLGGKSLIQDISINQSQMVNVYCDSRYGHSSLGALGCVQDYVSYGDSKLGIVNYCSRYVGSVENNCMIDLNNLTQN